MLRDLFEVILRALSAAQAQLSGPAIGFVLFLLTLFLVWTFWRVWKFTIYPLLHREEPKFLPYCIPCKLLFPTCRFMKIDNVS